LSVPALHEPRARLLRPLAPRGLVIAAAFAATDPKASYREWQSYNGDYGGAHYSELDQINKSNVKRLQLAWTWKTGDVGSTIECNPIIVDGVMFVTTGQLHAAALDAATGKLLWRFDPWEGAPGCASLCKKSRSSSRRCATSPMPPTSRRKRPTTAGILPPWKVPWTKRRISTASS
jgi:glucose dehydrogenase